MGAMFSFGRGPAESTNAPPSLGTRGQRRRRISSARHDHIAGRSRPQKPSLQGIPVF
jgi:hypothetical protein